MICVYRYEIGCPRPGRCGKQPTPGEPMCYQCKPREATPGSTTFIWDIVGDPSQSQQPNCTYLICLRYRVPITRLLWLSAASEASVVHGLQACYLHAWYRLGIKYSYHSSLSVALPVLFV